MRPDAAREEGSATVLVLCLCVLLSLVIALATACGQVAVTRHRAAAAADLAALAAAGRALDGPAVACARARAVVEAQGAELLSCLLVGDVASVTARVRPAGPLGALGVAQVRARAGQAGASAQSTSPARLTTARGPPSRSTRAGLT